MISQLVVGTALVLSMLHDGGIPGRVVAVSPTVRGQQIVCATSSTLPQTKCMTLPTSAGKFTFGEQVKIVYRGTKLSSIVHWYD